VPSLLVDIWFDLGYIFLVLWVTRLSPRNAVVIPSFIQDVLQLGALAAMSRQTFTTRMLMTVIPSEHYAANGATLQTILRALVADFNHLIRHGVEASGS
jgi:hypothetical protein